MRQLRNTAYISNHERHSAVSGDLIERRKEHMMLDVSKRLVPELYPGVRLICVEETETMENNLGVELSIGVHVMNLPPQPRELLDEIKHSLQNDLPLSPLGLDFMKEILAVYSYALDMFEGKVKP